MRSPEVVLGHPISQTQDIWSFGCLVFEIITATPLFAVYPLFSNRTTVGSLDEDHCSEFGDEKDVFDGEDEDKEQKYRKRDKAIDTEQQECDTKKVGNDKPATSHYEEDEEEPSPDDEHLQQFACVLRPLPTSILSQWPSAPKFFDQNGEAKHDKVDNVPPYESLEVLFDKDKPIDVDATERVAVLDLVRHILQYEPQKRPSAAQLLEHPWFAGADT